MTLTTIEKAAKLMGLEYEVIADEVFIPETIPDLPDWRLFNPYTHKSDLMDVECELEIDIDWRNNHGIVLAKNSRDIRGWVGEKISDHPTKFAAKAEAVMAVVEQIYDAKFGKDGE